MNTINTLFFGLILSLFCVNLSISANNSTNSFNHTIDAITLGNALNLETEGVEQLEKTSNKKNPKRPQKPKKVKKEKEKKPFFKTIFGKGLIILGIIILLWFTQALIARGVQLLIPSLYGTNWQWLYWSIAGLILHFLLIPFFKKKFDKPEETEE